MQLAEDLGVDDPIFEVEDEEENDDAEMETGGFVVEAADTGSVDHPSTTRHATKSCQTYIWCKCPLY